MQFNHYETCGICHTYGCKHTVKLVVDSFRDVTLTLQDRVKLYNEAFPKYPNIFYDKGWVIGCWAGGNNYRNESQLYGAFPRGFLKRLMSLFPDKTSILHLFSGSLPSGSYTRIDINPEMKPDIIGNAEELSFITDKKFNLIISDPPYSPSDAKIYGCKMPNRFKVTKECYKVSAPGAYLCWLDERLPMYRKDQWKRVGDILITRSTNHRFRALSIFERV